jgi:nitrogen fixation protein NifX
MKVAFASSDGLQVNQHFGQATAFHVWEIQSDSAECIGRIEQPTRDAEDEDHILAKATALEGCSIACSMQIGGPAAAKLVARHIHPMKTNSQVPISELVAKLQDVLRGDAPPWLAKAVGMEPKRRIVESTDD